MHRLTVPGIAWFLALALGIVVAASSYGRLDSEGLQGVWLLDEGGGMTVSDSSGNGHHGAFRGQPTWVDGWFGGALSFDGKDDWVEMTGWSTPEMENFTLGCWVKPADVQKQWANIMDTRQEPPTRGVSYEMDSDRTNSFYLAWGSAAGWIGPPYVVSLDEDKWQHLVGVRNGRDQIIYLDGRRKDGLAVVRDPVVAGTANFRIGNWANDGRHFAGVVDEVLLFSRALTKKESTVLGDRGLGAALDVSAAANLATTWASVRRAP